MNTTSPGVFLLKSQNYDTLYPERDENGMALQTRALAFCMHSCGINRLFSLHEVEELVFRLTVAHKHLNLLDNFFGEDYFFEFKLLGNPFRIDSEDLLAHIGLHVEQFPDQETPFDQWLERIENYFSSAVFIAALKGLIIPGLEKISAFKNEKDWSFNMKQIDIKPSDELINNARILSANFLKDIPTAPFKWFNETYAEKLNEINEVLEFAKSPLPISFSWDSLSPEAKKGIREHFDWLFDKELHPEATLEEMDQLAEMPISMLVYLAWLNANGFVYDLGPGDFDPRVDIDYFDFQVFEREDGFCLQRVYNDFELGHLEPFLEVV